MGSGKQNYLHGSVMKLFLPQIVPAFVMLVSAFLAINVFVILNLRLLPVVKAQETPVKQWGLWEKVFTTTQTHNWWDFPLRVRYRHSGGTELVVDGYYDGQDAGGNRVWKVRFSPTLSGTWNWDTSLSSSGLAEQSGSFAVSAPSPADKSNNPNYRGHIRVRKSGDRANRIFEYADGTPFLWLGDTTWHMADLRSGVGCDSVIGVQNCDNNNTNFMTWLNDRKAKKFTVAQVQLYSRTHKNEGGYPFIGNEQPTAGKDPEDQSGGNGNYANLNPLFFAYLDVRMKRLWEAGLVVAAHPTWTSGENIALSNSGADAREVFRYMLARYGAFNTVWSLSGEYQYKYPAWSLCWNYSTNAPNTSCEWNQLGQAVAAYNVYKHPVSIHSSGRAWGSAPTEWGAKASEQSSAGEFHNQSWLDHNWTQTGHADSRLRRVYERTVNDYQRSPAKPVVHSEGFYENEKVEGADAYEVRWQVWTALLNGAAGHTYGALGVWQFYDPSFPVGQRGWLSHDGTTWKTALNETCTNSKYLGGCQVRYVSDLLRSVAWWKLVPHRDWMTVNGAAVGVPTSSDISPVHMAAEAGKTYVVYVPRGNSGRIIVINNLNSANYTARWFNPRTGVWTDIANDPVGVGSWTVPARPDSEDWVMVLTPPASATPIPSPSFTFSQLKSLLSNYLTNQDSQYFPKENKVNMLDAGYVVKWIN